MENKDEYLILLIRCMFNRKHIKELNIDEIKLCFSLIDSLSDKAFVLFINNLHLQVLEEIAKLFVNNNSIIKRAKSFVGTNKYCILTKCSKQNPLKKIL